MSWKRKWTTWLVSFLFFIATSSLIIACSPQAQQPTSASKTLTVAISPWPGYSGHYVAMAQELFKAEGLEVQELSFTSQTEADTAFLAGKVDLNWTGLPNAIPQVSRDPNVKIMFQCDYSNGSDGIIGRGIKTAADLKGKEIARENVLFEELLLRKYLEKLGVKREEVKILDMAAADAATAFTAGKVDVAVTYEPWMTKAAQEGKGEILFTSKDTSIIPDGIVVKAETLKTKLVELTAYLKAIDKAVQVIKAKPDSVQDIIAKALTIKPEEVAAQVGGVKLYDIAMNKSITFNRSEPMNLHDSLDFASKIAVEMKLIPQAVDVTTVMHDEVVKAS